MSEIRRRMLTAAMHAWPARLREAARGPIEEMHYHRCAEATRAVRPFVMAADMLGIAWAGLAARRTDPWLAHRYRVDSAQRSTSVERLRHDIGFAFRSFRRRPGIAAISILTCALGVGAATAMFSVTDGVMLRPLPFEGEDRLVMVYPTIEEWRTDPVFMDIADRASFSKPEFVEWKRRQTSFEYAAGLSSGSATIQGSGEPERIAVAYGTDELFPMLGIRPATGRFYSDGEVASEAAVAVLTHAFWTSRFGARREVIGRTIDLNDVPHTIIGVLPREFSSLALEGEVWKPMSRSPGEESTNHDMHVIARLKPGVSAARAQSEAASILNGLSIDGRSSGHDITHRATVVTRLEEQTRDVRGPLKLLVIATAVLLLAACTAVAGLLLGTGIERETELAVRGALGASSGRLVRQLLTENLLLALLGGVGGMLLAVWLTRLLLIAAPPGMPRIDEIGVNIRVLAFTVACTSFVGLLFGLVPALSLGRADLTRRIGTTRVTNRRRTRLHGGLVTAQVALATVLLGGAGLLVRTMIELYAVEPGFETRNVIMVKVSPQWSRFSGKPPELLTSYHEALRSALASTPGIESATAAGMLPFSGGRWTTDVSPVGYRRAPGEKINVSRHSVSSHYFHVLSLRLLEGRLFTEEDDQPNSARVTVVSAQFARKFWPGQSAVGREIDTGSGRMLRVIGVVADTHDEGLTEDAMPRFYIPRRQDGNGGGMFAVRTNGDPAEIIPELKRRIRMVDPAVPITRIETMDRLIADSIAPQRYRATLITAFAGFAALLSLLATYGVVARSVAGRAPEMALRLALGAPRGRILRMVLGQGARLAAAGVVAGVIVFVAGAEVLSSFLFGTTPLDPVTIGIIAALMLTLAVLSVLPPSLRAARVAPWDAMRSGE